MEGRPDADQAGQEKISVAAPPEESFDVAADLERYLEWAADIKEAARSRMDDPVARCR